VPKKGLVRRPDSTMEVSDTGLLANIERLREAEKNAAMAYRDSQGGDIGATQLLHREWIQTSEQLRKAEVSTPGVLFDNQSTMPVDEVEEEFVRMGTQFRVAAEAIPRSLPPRLMGLDEAGIQEVLRGAIRELLEQLSTEKW